MSAKSFFLKISSGDFSLAKTYWLYWVLVLIAINTLMMIRPTTATLVIAGVAHAAYLTPMVIGIWRAANQREGGKIWAVIWAVLVTAIAILAIISVILMLIMVSMLIEAPGQTGLGI